MASPTPQAASAPPTAPKAPLSPETIRRIETNRLKAKAIRDRLDAEARSGVTSSTTTQKRPFSDVSPSKPGQSRKGGEGRENIRPAKKFAKFVEYDLSKMTDTKGGFMSTEDDPNSILAAENLKDKPKNMSIEEWNKHQLRLKLQREKKGAWEPAIGLLREKGDKVCRECESREVDWKWAEAYRCVVCEKCKKAHPDKYSLLTKTECKEDYMLTDPELRDAEVLPHMEVPNPHKSTWSNMMLYVKYQVEEFAEKKWGGFDKMDEEFEKREAEKKKKKENKFRAKLGELKKRTRVEQWKKAGGLQRGEKHEHAFGVAVEQDGMSVRTCEGCGFELEELVF